MLMGPFSLKELSRNVLPKLDFYTFFRSYMPDKVQTSQFYYIPSLELVYSNPKWAYLTNVL